MQCDGCTKMTPMKAADVVGTNNIFACGRGIGMVDEKLIEKMWCNVPEAPEFRENIEIVEVSEPGYEIGRAHV